MKEHISAIDKTKKGFAILTNPFFNIQ